MCKAKHPTEKQLASHVKSSHPNFCFQCKYCDRKFANLAGLYKHEKKHGAPMYVCSHCDRGFYYPLNLKEHVKIHTPTNMYPCTNCSKQFASQWLMDQNKATHENQHHKCDQWNMVCNTVSNLNQHKKGAHGPGWPSKCGKKFDWPMKKARHKKVWFVQVSETPAWG